LRYFSLPNNHHIYSPSIHPPLTKTPSNKQPPHPVASALQGGVFLIPPLDHLDNNMPHSTQLAKYMSCNMWFPPIPTYIPFPRTLTTTKQQAFSCIIVNYYYYCSQYWLIICNIYAFHSPRPYIFISRLLIMNQSADVAVCARIVLKKQNKKYFNINAVLSSSLKKKKGCC